MSAWVRRLRLERLMHWLPGVSPVPEDPDVLWEGAAGTGAPLEASLPMTAAQVVRLRDGDAITLTAMRVAEPVYSIALSTESQVDAVGALLRYMEGQLAVDLLRIAPPNG